VQCKSASHVIGRTSEDIKAGGELALKHLYCGMKLNSIVLECHAALYEFTL